MEFLATNFDFGEADTLLNEFRTVSLEEDWKLSACDYGGFRVYINGRLLTGKNSDFAFDGSAMFDGRLVTLFRNYDIAGLRSLRDAARERLGDIVGAFCLLTVNKPQQRFLLQYDALNAYPSFLLRDGDRYAISNNVHFVEVAARAAGRRLTRSVLPYLADFAIGSAYDVGSTFREVEIVGPRQTVMGRADGVRVRTHAIGGREANSHEAYEDAIGHAAERLRGRIETVAANFEEPNVYFDLTGGMDSRVVLASIVSRQPRLSWDFRTLFDPPHPDGHCAALLSEKFGLGRVHGVPADERRSLSAVDRIRFDTFASMGVGAKQGFMISPAYSDIAHIHGGYGEIAGASPDAKRFLSQKGLLTYRLLPQNYIKRLEALKILKFFTADGVEWLTDLLTARLGRYETAGVAPEDAPLHYYNDGRLRSHFGMTSRLRSQSRSYIDLLYDMHLQHCALLLPPRMRVAGKVNFDLIRLLGGDGLVALPMANLGWDAALFAGGAVPATLNAPPVTSATPQTVAPLPQKRSFEPMGAKLEAPFVSRPDPKLPSYDITRVDRPYRDILRRQVFLATYLPQTRSAQELQPLVRWEEVDALLAAPAETLLRYPYDLLLQALCDMTIWHQEMELSVFR